MTEANHPLEDQAYDQPETLGNVHYIDTGGFHTGRLTLIEAREVVA
ncbi:hypothetical protein [Halomonas korlensis]|uniref:Serine/threonine protein phosphatase 1 n=1 Tax=Halomonas korlensis TaxID=463301 RepID=A0A1I7JMG7_9GAMM|nr:hypothetical protein [Halomonas korlensis]SFU86347.1 serine/threonine protein phosphatase 1 [Halomonas korlensis]